MEKLKKSIGPIVGVIVASIILIILSKLIFAGGFLPDKYNKGMGYYKASVIEILEENLQDETASQELIDAVTPGSALVNEILKKDRSQQLKSFEKSILRYAIKYGMGDFKYSTDKDGNAVFCKVIDFLQVTMQQENLLINIRPFTDDNISITYFSAISR